MKHPKIIILICLFSALFVGLVFVWPKYQEYIKTRHNLANKEEFLKNNSQYFKKIREMFSRLEQDKELAAKVVAAIPSLPDYDKLIGYFEKTTAENGLIISKINISEPKEFKEIEEIKKIKEIKIFLNLVGTYASFNNFLSKIEKSARLFEVEEISFTAPQKGLNLFSFEVKLRVYSY